MFYGQYGTIYAQNDTSSSIFVIPKVNGSVSNCFTVLPIVNMSMDPDGFNPSKQLLQVKVSGIVKAILLYQSDSKPKGIFDDQVRLPIMSVQDGSILYMALFNSIDTSVILPIITSSLSIQNDALVVPSGNIQLQIRDQLYMRKGNIRFPLYNYATPERKTVFLYLITEKIFNMSNSTISFTDALTLKRNAVVTFVLEPRGSIQTDNTILSSDTLVMNYTAIKSPNITGIVLIKGSNNYCPPMDVPSTDLPAKQTASDYLSKMYLTNGSNSPGGLFDNSGFIRTIKDTEEYFNSTLIVLSQDTMNVRLPNVTDFGYIGFYSSNDLVISSDTTLNASASGCSPNVLGIQSISSKYLKICKVIGGTHVGRGGLGSQKNFENCKYVLSTNKPQVFLPNRIVPGMGGQKNHQMETDKSGFGGGVVSLYSNTQLILQGNLLAEGGPKSEKDYTMIAGGSGGTVSLSSVKILIGGNISVNGGLGDSEVEFSLNSAWWRWRRKTLDQLLKLGH